MTFFRARDIENVIVIFYQHFCARYRSFSFFFRRHTRKFIEYLNIFKFLIFPTEKSSWTRRATEFGKSPIFLPRHCFTYVDPSPSGNWRAVIPFLGRVFSFFSSFVSLPSPDNFGKAASPLVSDRVSTPHRYRAAVYPRSPSVSFSSSANFSAKCRSNIGELAATGR